MQYCQGKVLLCVADEARKTGYLDDPRIMSLKFSDKWVQWLIILSNKSSAAMSCIPSGSQPPIDDDYGGDEEEDRDEDLYFGEEEENE
jgi:hypothetical protein